MHALSVLQNNSVYFTIHNGFCLDATAQVIFLQDICRWTPPWYTVDDSKYPLFLCRRSSWICGSTRNSIQLIRSPSLFDCLWDCAMLCNSAINIFCDFEWAVSGTLLSFLLEEGPNNWSSCCTFKKTGKNGRILNETDLSVYVAEVVFYFLNHPIRHTRWTWLTE